MKQITQNVYGVLTKFNLLNQYIIVNGNNLTVVDTMINANDIDQLEKELKKQNWSLDQIKNILITHAHPDHIGGLVELQKRSNATTYAHRIDAQIIRGEANGVLANPSEIGFVNRIIHHFASANAQPQPARVDVDLGDGSILNEVTEGLQVIHLPGHSYGQVGYYIPGGKLLIGGDVLMRFGGSLRMPLRAVSPDWNAVKQSIRHIAELEIDILCLGHGKPLYNAKPVIEKFAQSLV